MANKGFISRLFGKSGKDDSGCCEISFEEAPAAGKEVPDNMKGTSETDCCGGGIAREDDSERSGDRASVPGSERGD